MKKLLVILLLFLLVSCSEDKSSVLKAFENCTIDKLTEPYWMHNRHPTKQWQIDEYMAKPLKERLKNRNYFGRFKDCEEEHTNSPITFHHNYGD